MNKDAYFSTAKKIENMIKTQKLNQNKIVPKIFG